MPIPVDGLTGKITSWGASGDDVYQMVNAAIRPVSFTISANGNPWDSTALDGAGTAMEKTGGLFDGSFTFDALYPLLTPVMANNGLLTLGSSYYNYFTKSWFLDIDFGEHDITAFAAGGNTAKLFRPAGRIEWSGGWTSRMSSGAYPSLPTAANGSGITAVFALSNGTADAGFSGTIVVSQFTKTVAVARNLIEVSYTFQGNGTLTSVAGDSGPPAYPAILPVGTVDTASWDVNADGTPDVNVILQTATSRTLTSASFLRSLHVEAVVDQPAKVSGVGRFTGAVTLA